MPLKKVSSTASKATKRKVASTNIKREIRAGKPRKQAVAIGLRSAHLSTRLKRKARKK
jgi:hypothetical protein